MNTYVDSCSSRYPTDDDDLLLDRPEYEGIDDSLAARIRSAIGEAPELVGHPIQWGLDAEKRRRIMWAHTMRFRVELPDGWKPCLDVVVRLDDETKRDYIWYTLGESEVQYDAMPDGYGTDAPLEVATKIAAKEPGASRFQSPTDGRTPVYELETAVRDNVAGWIEDPAAIIHTLRRPEYVAGYLRGLGAEYIMTQHADRIIFAVKLVRDIRRDNTIGSTPFYYDGKLTSVDMVGIELIEKVIKNDIGLCRDTLAGVWSVVVDGIICPDIETDEQVNCSIEYLQAVDELPHVRAVSTLIGMMRYAKRNDAYVPRMALIKLADILRLTGQYGVDYHACIGPRASFMRGVEPEWLEQNEPYLFGSAVSAELGRVALDMHLMYGPADFILVKYQDEVFDAVKRDVPNALYHLLDGMLSGMCCYEPEYVAVNLMEIGPEYISKTGWYMPKLLPKDDTERVQYGMAYWDNILKRCPESKALAGFGWWADVPGIDHMQWEELMLRTCMMTKKVRLVIEGGRADKHITYHNGHRLEDTCTVAQH